MKKSRNFVSRSLPIVLIVSLSACTSYDYVVHSDYSYDGNFDRYKSFAFVSNLNFGGSEVEKETIERYLSGTLKAWGYELTDRRPGLMIFYSVYYEDLTFRGFNQPEFQHWIRSNYSDKEVVFKRDTLPDGTIEEALSTEGRSHSDETYDKVNYDFREGTLLISMLDRKKRKVIWQGYASGIFGPDSQKNERILRSAIGKILDEYRLLAFDAS